MPGQKAPEEERREQILQAAYVVALRAGIDGVTVRAVAAEAGLSHGLVLFHFKRKDQLVAALLDRVLATTTLVHASADGTRPGRAPDRLRALLRQELEHLVGTPRDIRLFFEYWALGARQPAIRAKIGTALDRYREAFRTVAEEALRADHAGRTGVTPDGFAAVAVSLVSGGAVQAMADPEAFDMTAYLGTVKGIIEQLAAPAAAAAGAVPRDAPAIRRRGAAVRTEREARSDHRYR
jgi:AcrR family transcriptional regulator